MCRYISSKTCTEKKTMELPSFCTNLCCFQLVFKSSAAFHHSCSALTIINTAINLMH